MSSEQETPQADASGYTRSGNGPRSWDDVQWRVPATGPGAWPGLAYSREGEPAIMFLIEDEVARFAAGEPDPGKSNLIRHLIARIGEKAEITVEDLKERRPEKDDLVAFKTNPNDPRGPWKVLEVNGTTCAIRRGSVTKASLSIDKLRVAKGS